MLLTAEWYNVTKYDELLGEEVSLFFFFVGHCDYFLQKIVILKINRAPYKSKHCNNNKKKHTHTDTLSHEQRVNRIFIMFGTNQLVIS